MQASIDGKPMDAQHTLEDRKRVDFGQLTTSAVAAGYPIHAPMRTRSPLSRCHALERRRGAAEETRLVHLTEARSDEAWSLRELLRLEQLGRTHPKDALKQLEMLLSNSRTVAVERLIRDQIVRLKAFESKKKGWEFNDWLVIAGIVFGLVAILAITAFAWSPQGRSATLSGWTVGGSAAGVTAAAAAIGSMTGFLFGVPRVPEIPEPGVAPESKSEASAVNLPVQERAVLNSNLVQVSDWLTKILLGAGLVQLGKLPATLGALGTVLAPALGGSSSSAAFGVCMALYGFFVAFNLVFMWTSTRFLKVWRDGESNHAGGATV